MHPKRKSTTVLIINMWISMMLFIGVCMPITVSLVVSASNLIEGLVYEEVSR